MATSTDHTLDLSDPDEPSFTLLWGTWEMWCDVPQTSEANQHGSSWLDRVKNVGLFDSVEGYWSIFNCTLLPSQLPPSSSYYLFRRHIAPLWEHEANRRGGKWVVSFAESSVRARTTGSEGPATPPRHSGNEQNNADDDEEEEELQPVDAVWQKMSLAAIGELYPCAEEEICGVSVSRGAKGGWKVALWTRTAEDGEAQKKIAAYLRELLAAELLVEDTTAGEATRTPEKRSGSYPAEAALTYVVHRELMMAKKNYADGTPSKPFQPRYTA